MIRKALPEDMDQILEVYQAARAYMRSSGNEQQWGENHPPAELLTEDIQQGQLYVVLEEGAVHGVFAFIMGEEPSYARIEGGRWKNDAPYGTIHRVAGDGKVRGIFQQCLDFCKSLSPNIRIDTHNDNKTMQHLIEKNGFQMCGTVYVEDGSPRIAYQYVEDAC